MNTRKLVPHLRIYYLLNRPEQLSGLWHDAIQPIASASPKALSRSTIQTFRRAFHPIRNYAHSAILEQIYSHFPIIPRDVFIGLHGCRHECLLSCNRARTNSKPSARISFEKLRGIRRVLQRSSIFQLIHSRNRHILATDNMLDLRTSPSQ